MADGTWEEIEEEYLNPCYADLVYGIKEVGQSVISVSIILGVNRQSVYQWNRTGRIKDHYIVGLSEILNVDPEELRELFRRKKEANRKREQERKKSR